VAPTDAAGDLVLDEWAEDHDRRLGFPPTRSDDGIN